MKSMTGFGKGESEFSDYHLAVEVSSVNRKQLEARISLPPALSEHDALIRKMVAESISRGAVSVKVTLDSQKKGGSAAVNRELLNQLVAECIQIRRTFCLPLAVNVEELLSVPGVMASTEQQLDSETCGTALQQAMAAALVSFDKMRTLEGGQLRQDLLARLGRLKELLAQIEPLAEEVPGNLKKKLLEKLEKESLVADPNDERLLKEVLFYADKADVCEEITRLKSHFVHMASFLDEAAPVGRSMDFLIQEMFREITTLGNKVAGSAASVMIVAFKSELEKMREQLQNVE